MNKVVREWIEAHADLVPLGVRLEGDSEALEVFCYVLGVGPDDGVALVDSRRPESGMEYGPAFYLAAVTGGRLILRPTVDEGANTLTLWPLTDADVQRIPPPFEFDGQPQTVAELREWLRENGVLPRGA